MPETSQQIRRREQNVQNLVQCPFLLQFERNEIGKNIPADGVLQTTVKSIFSIKTISKNLDSAFDNDLQCHTRFKRFFFDILHIFYFSHFSFC